MENQNTYGGKATRSRMNILQNQAEEGFSMGGGGGGGGGGGSKFITANFGGVTESQFHMEPKKLLE